MHKVKVSGLCIVLISAFPLNFVQLFGIFICLGGAFLLHKYRYNGLFFSSFYIVLPVLLAVVSGVILLIGGSLGCGLSHTNSSCLQALVRNKMKRQQKVEK